MIEGNTHSFVVRTRIELTVINNGEVVVLARRSPVQEIREISPMKFPHMRERDPDTVPSRRGVVQRRGNVFSGERWLTFVVSLRSSVQQLWHAN